ncbi:hypothetical protein LTR62_004203 [Meristemomyces frigidus]|uniref:Uncharacterized protein n=1 Tax=Meristemomyces frigidus TaxID=1508187 RepID=A0AAN7TI95_9PEZI|nr:hypothetical protein LTR62_004203 [Meristemomyces frigidus]
MQMARADVATNGLQQLAGTKRPADESSLNDDQRFTKRFHLLSIDKSIPNGNASSNFYIPVPTTAKPANGELSAQQPDTRTWNNGRSDELMNVDETRDRVYIHDLDAELADIQTEEEQLIFLPDIEKRLSRIPQQLLSGRHTDDGGHHELVLYEVPKSLTVDEDRDSVRKAIIEARQRARDRAVEDARQEDMVRKYGHDGHEAVETAHGYSAGYEAEEDADPDAMDIG